MLNGFPARLVVPGWYATYWVKNLSEITVLTDRFENFWMKPGYRIPDTPCGCVEPGTAPKNTVPIHPRAPNEHAAFVHFHAACLRKRSRSRHRPNRGRKGAAGVLAYRAHHSEQREHAQTEPFSYSMCPGKSNCADEECEGYKAGRRQPY